MSNNTDRIFGWGLVILTISILSYFIIRTALVFALKLSPLTSQATITSTEVTNEKLSLSYSYTSQFDGVTYNLEKELTKDEYMRFQDMAVFSVTYSRYFPEYTILDKIEDEPSMIFLVIGIIFMAVAVRTFYEIAQGQLTLDQVFGNQAYDWISNKKSSD